MVTKLLQFILGGEIVSRRIISLLIAFTFILSSFTMVSAANFTDVGNHENKDAIYRLKELNILSGYPDGTYGPNKAITRAETAAIMARISGLEEIANMEKGKETSFSDVSRNHWASGYVKVANVMEIATGKGNKIFAPNANVLIQEIVAMVVRTLDYNNIVTKPYPHGELEVARDLGLLDGVGRGIYYATPATRAEVAQIIENALHVPMMVYSNGEYVPSDSDSFGFPPVYLMKGMGL